MPFKSIVLVGNSERNRFRNRKAKPDGFRDSKLKKEILKNIADFRLRAKQNYQF